MKKRIEHELKTERTAFLFQKAWDAVIAVVLELLDCVWQQTIWAKLPKYAKVVALVLKGKKIDFDATAATDLMQNFLSALRKPQAVFQQLNVAYDDAMDALQQMQLSPKPGTSQV